MRAKTLPDILIEVLKKIESSVDSAVDKLEAQLDAVGKRVSELEQKREISAGGAVPAMSSSSATSQHLSLLMAVESEKAERAKRQRNVIITGLLTDRGTSDEDLFVKFCEENMTSKLKLIRCQRLGHDLCAVMRGCFTRPILTVKRQPLMCLRKQQRSKRKPPRENLNQQRLLPVRSFFDNKELGKIPRGLAALKKKILANLASCMPSSRQAFWQNFPESNSSEDLLKTFE